MSASNSSQTVLKDSRKCVNQNIQVYVRQRPLNSRERSMRSLEVVEVISPQEIVARNTVETKVTKKFTFDRVFGSNSCQVDVYSVVVAPLVSEVIAGYNCTVFAYGQTGTGKTHTMVGTACPNLTSSWDDNTDVGIIPRALSHLIDELRLMGVDFSMRISYLELYNEELCDLLSTDDSVRIRIYEDSTKKGSVIIHGLEEIPVHSKDDVYKLLEKGQERRKTATTLMNAQSSRSHTVFSITVHIREKGSDGEEMLKIGKLNLVDLAGSENATKAGTDKSARVREAVNINQSLLTLGRVITALVERAPHIPYRESKLTRLLQESLGGRTKTSIIATVSPGHKDIEETLSTLQYADRAKSIQNKPEINQKLTKSVVLKEYSEEIEKLKRDLMATRDKNGIYLSEEHYNEINNKMDAQHRELNEKNLLVKALKDEMQNKERLFNEISDNLAQKVTELVETKNILQETQSELRQKELVLNKTKKCYHENKMLLESHVRTEEVLTNQANEILKVADVATNDTQQLHSTIELRKNVDRENEKTCDQFMNQMKEHFDMFESNLKMLQENQMSKTDLINQKLVNNMKRQTELNNNTSLQIDAVLKVLGETSEKTEALEENVSKLLKDASEDHKRTFCDLFEKQKEIYETQQRHIQSSLNRLARNCSEQTVVATNLFVTMHNAFQSLTKERNDFENVLKKQFDKSFIFLQSCIDKNVILKKDILNDYKLLKEEETMFEDIFQKLSIMRENRLTQMGSKVMLTDEIENKYLSLKQNLTNCASNSDTIFDKHNINQQTIEKDIKEQITQSQTLIKTNQNDCTEFQSNLETFCKQNKIIIDELVQKENKHCEQLQRNFKNQYEDIANLHSDRNEIHIAAVENVRSTICDFLQKSKSEIARVSSHTTDLQDSIDNYSEVHKKQVSNCANDLEKFRKVEFKTYSPTGATPSKRNFVYPRVLAATSPHEKIIKRLRKDVTTAIDEEETELSLAENSQASFLRNTSPNILTSLNSTPINKNEQNKSVCDKENIPIG